MSSYTVNPAAVERARHLIDAKQYVLASDWREAQPRARVILMTTYGYDPSHSIVKARQEGLRCVLYKPFRIDQLLDAHADVRNRSFSANERDSAGDLGLGRKPRDKSNKLRWAGT